MSPSAQMTVAAENIVMQMIHGKCLSSCVSLAAELSIADHLANGPMNILALAEATQTEPEAFYRVLRLLAGVGLFEELADRNFRNSRLSETLIGDSPPSVRDYARWFGREIHWQL
jgi:hypothetical protein